LANYIVSVQVKNEHGYVVNSFAAVQIPDWAVKQRLDDIDAAIQAITALGESASARQSPSVSTASPPEATSSR
jgi:hypothetical protein